jgi:hypothetical protein
MDDGEQAAAKTQEATDEEGKSREATSGGEVDLLRIDEERSSLLSSFLLRASSHFSGRLLPGEDGRFGQFFYPYMHDR